MNWRQIQLFMFSLSPVQQSLYVKCLKVLRRANFKQCNRKKKFLSFPLGYPGGKVHMRHMTVVCNMWLCSCPSLSTHMMCKWQVMHTSWFITCLWSRSLCSWPNSQGVTVREQVSPCSHSVQDYNTTLLFFFLYRCSNGPETVQLELGVVIKAKTELHYLDS